MFKYICKYAPVAQPGRALCTTSLFLSLVEVMMWLLRLLSERSQVQILPGALEV